MNDLKVTRSREFAAQLQTVALYSMTGAVIGRTVGNRLFGKDGGDVLSFVLFVAGAYTGVTQIQH